MKTRLGYLLFVCALAACGGGGGNAQSPAAKQDMNKCAQHSEPAVKEVQAVIDQNSACSSDADCVSIGVGSKCFDICSRSINKSGVEAAKAAMSTASNGSCKAFLEAGCQVIPPPCAPPMEPRCNEGKCI